MAFGSYGWAPAAPEALDAGLRAIGWEMLGPPITSKYRPTPEVLDQCRDCRPGDGGEGE